MRNGIYQSQREGSQSCERWQINVPLAQALLHSSVTLISHVSCCYTGRRCFQAVEPEESELLLWWWVGWQRHVEYKHDHCSVLKTWSSHYWGLITVAKGVVSLCCFCKGKNVQKSITAQDRDKQVIFFSGFILTVNAHIGFLEVADTVEATSFFPSYPKDFQLTASHWESPPTFWGFAWISL